MTKTFTALIAATTLTPRHPPCHPQRMGASAAQSAPANGRPMPPGCVYYPYGEPLPGPNCSWYRMPVFGL
jgi:hypothetical protein